MDTLRIVGKQNDSGEEKKSRAFQTRLVGYLSADSLWELGRSSDIERPLWITWTGTEQEVRAFSANVRTGRRFRREEGRRECEQIEIPKTGRFRYVSEKGPDGTAIVTAYHPGLLHLDPPEVDEKWIRFLCLPPIWWVDAQLPALRQVLGPDTPEEELRETAVAAMVAAYLDRRTGLPIIDDLRFLRQMVAAGLEQSLLLERTEERHRTQPKAEPAKIPGLERMIACCARQDAFEEFLKEEIKKHYAAEIAAGRCREPVPSPIVVPETVEQLRLF